MRPKYAKLVEHVEIPRMALARQVFEAVDVHDPAHAVHEALAASPHLSGLKKGMRVALTVGSRGIASLPQLVRAIVDELRERGAEPFIVPAMGSHGGGTAEGQIAATLALRKKQRGAPVVPVWKPWKWACVKTAGPCG